METPTWEALAEEVPPAGVEEEREPSGVMGGRSTQRYNGARCVATVHANRESNGRITEWSVVFSAVHSNG